MAQQAVKIYTDGACKKNGSSQAIGGLGVYWGKDDPRNVSRRVNVPGVTNNICELMAIQVALEAISGMRHSPDDMTRYIIASDSKYSIDCVTTWFDGFVKRNWVSTAGSPVKNKDLICDIHRRLKWMGERVRLEYVRGHAGNEGNEAADALAVAGCDAEGS